MNWSRTIAEARRRGRFTRAERLNACSWDTCALSERQHQKMLTAPADPILGQLGLKFAEAVDHSDFNTAESILESIEARTKPREA